MIRKALTENGWVVGLPASDPRVTSYKGIPFAAPPVGKNRWRAPQPCDSWEGEFKAYEFAPISMQATTGLDKTNIYTREWAVDPTIAMEEDCLYLNIWAPAEDDRKNMPVFVWYFGGGLQVGNTAEMEFDGERLARRGIIVVTINYRLNAFGFLCHPEITAESPDANCNFGFLDQQFGTQWVKRNIAAFGGDPDNITIGGQSAGGMSVGAQISNLENEGLFHRAIIESGMFAPAYPMLLTLEQSVSEAEQRGIRFFKYLGVNSLEEARQIEAHALLKKVLEWEEQLPWCAAADGKFCHEEGPWYALKDRIHCAILTGNTDNEFVLTPEATDDSSLETFTDRIAGIDRERFLSLFPHPATKEDIERCGTLNAVEFAVRMAYKAMRASGDSSPFYYYCFHPDIPGWDNPGAFHSVDLWFFFETLAKCWRPFVGHHYDLARKMCDCWVNFIRSGDPNGMGTDGLALPYWPAFSDENPVCMTFAESARPEACPSCDLMDTLMDAYVKSGYSGLK